MDLMLWPFVHIKAIYDYERGVKFTLGKYSGLMRPGLNFIVPVIQTFRVVDTRISTMEIPQQEVMTRDNIPVNISAVVYYHINDPEKVIMKVEDHTTAVMKYSQNTMKNVSGAVTLDELLSSREKIASDMKQIVGKMTAEWGLNIDILELQDISMPADLKRVMARQAEAEREKRAVIIKAEGEVASAKNLAKAATLLASEKGAMHLRTLQTLTDIGSDDTNHVNFIIPLETPLGQNPPKAQK